MLAVVCPVKFHLRTLVVGQHFGVRRVQLPENKCQGCRKEIGGIRKEDEGLCGSRMDLTGSVEEPRGMVSAVLLKLKPRTCHALSVSWHHWRVAPVRLQTLRCCSAAVALNTKPCMAALRWALP